MASRNVTTTFLARLLASIVGLLLVPLATAFLVLCIALFVVVMIVTIIWWIITGEWLIADSSEVSK